MVCPQCFKNTHIINSRLQKRSNSVWRRRRCLECHTVFTTHEATDYSALWRVKTSNPHLSPFNRDKLFMSLYKSLQHRDSALTDSAGLADTVIRKLAEAKSSLISGADIARTAAVALQRFDSVASVHYLAFHKP